MNAACASSRLLSRAWWVFQDYSIFGHMAPGLVKGLWFPLILLFPHFPLLLCPKHTLNRGPHDPDGMS